MQILVTFYQEWMCHRFPLTPLQGAANLLTAQHTHRLMFLSQPMNSILFSFLILFPIGVGGGIGRESEKAVVWLVGSWG